MRNDYEYLDLDYIYTDPKTGLLRNKEDIDDRKLLMVFEQLKCSARLEELLEHPIMPRDSGSLLEIHNYLFQDTYQWAGQLRKVEISKDGKQFFPRSHFDSALAYIDKLIVDFRQMDSSNKSGISGKLAEILDSVNYLHPFREGNGRTQREFLRVLALEKGYELNLNPADNSGIYERYMTGTIEGDVDKLGKLICEIISENSGCT
jgi:cell filamentation protein